MLTHYYHLKHIIIFGLCAVIILSMQKLEAQTQNKAPPQADTPLFFENLEADDAEINEALDFFYYPWSLEDLSQTKIDQQLSNVRFEISLLNDASARGRGLNGFVQAKLLQDNVKDALVDAYRIESPVWLAKSLIDIAEYLLNNEVHNQARGVLLDVREILHEIVMEGEDITNEVGGLMEDTASLFLTLNEIIIAIDIMEKIPDPLARVSALHHATAYAVNLKNQALVLADDGGTPYDNAVEYAKSAVLAAMEFAKTLNYREPEVGQRVGQVHLKLIFALLALEQYQEGLTALDNLQNKVRDGPKKGRDKNLLDMATAYIEADDPKTAMEMVRELSNAGKRARALAAVARARVVKGDIEAATPLFIMAGEEAERVRNNSDRIHTYNSMIHDFTHAGRLADAFEMAGKIDIQPDQGITIAEMANILLEREQEEEAKVLVQYIPQMELRAPLLAILAQQKGEGGDRIGASQDLLDAIAPGTIAPDVLAYPPIIQQILFSHTLYGSPDMDAQILSAMNKLVDEMPNNLFKVDALLHMSVALAETEQLDLARQTGNAAYRIAFDFDQDFNFPKAMEIISFGQALSGDLLAAFDAASRTRLPPMPEEIEDYNRNLGRRGNKILATVQPTDPTKPMETARYRALARAAAVAARVGEGAMALRAAKMMEAETGVGSAFAAIAVALSTKEVSIDYILRDVAHALEIEVYPTLASAITKLELTRKN